MVSCWCVMFGFCGGASGLDFVVMHGIGRCGTQWMWWIRCFCDRFWHKATSPKHSIFAITFFLDSSPNLQINKHSKHHQFSTTNVAIFHVSSEEMASKTFIRTMSNVGSTNCQAFIRSWYIISINIVNVYIYQSCGLYGFIEIKLFSIMANQIGGDLESDGTCSNTVLAME